MAAGFDNDFIDAPDTAAGEGMGRIAPATAQRAAGQADEDGRQADA